MTYRYLHGLVILILVLLIFNLSCVSVEVVMNHPALDFYHHIHESAAEDDIDLVLGGPELLH